jgi:hypothetical protein
LVNGGRSGGAGLLYSLLIICVLGGALALADGHGDRRAAAAASAQASDDAGQPSPLTQAQITRIAVASTPAVARRVAKLRDLRFDSLPKPEVVSAAYLNRLGLRELRRDGGLKGTGADEAVGRITGLLAPDEQLEAAYRSTGDLAAAAYDPATKRLYVVRDASAGGNKALVEFLLSHELDHALEDQNYGIGGGRHLDDDASLARQALIEGLATAVMEDYGAQYLNPFDLMAAAGGIDTGTGDVPKFLVDEMTWTYLGGYDYITALRQLAGSWKLVNYALDSRPPASTEQVLHPDKYVKNEQPATVRIASGGLRADGYEPVDRGDLGELGTSFLLTGKEGSGAAAGWNGDRYELWRKPGTQIHSCPDPCREGNVLVMRWSWDTENDATQFEQAAREYIEGELGGQAEAPGVWSLGPTALALSSGATTSAIVFAPTEHLARTVATAQLKGSAP